MRYVRKRILRHLLCVLRTIELKVVSVTARRLLSEVLRKIQSGFGLPKDVGANSTTDTYLSVNAKGISKVIHTVVLSSFKSPILDIKRFSTYD